MLKKIAKIFNSAFGDGVNAMRIGGEEFAILMPGHDIEQACKLVDSLLKTLASTAVVSDDLSIDVTASAGVIELEYSDPWDKAFVAADTALYEAKSLGRNRYQFRQRVNSPVQ